MELSTKSLAGAALLASLVIVLDYAVKYSGLKVPFPWIPFLKFDLTGIPIVLSLFLFGLAPGAFASAVAFIAILIRSGSILSSSMKGLAELLTVLGIFVGLKISSRFRLPASFALGITFRSLVMMGVNFMLISMGLVLVPSSYKQILLIFILLTGLFNVIQGAISILGGYSIYMAIKKRVPSLTMSKD